MSIIDKRYEQMHPEILEERNKESHQETLEVFHSIRKFSKVLPTTPSLRSNKLFVSHFGSLLVSCVHCMLP